MNYSGQEPNAERTGDDFSYSGEPSMAIPGAMEGLRGRSPSPFLTKTYDIVDDSNTNHVVCWSNGNNSFVVWDPETFSIQILPMYFKHGNLSSFIRQLNTYGFKKVDPDKLEFANEWFLRGQRHLLKNIKRRKPPLYPQASNHDLDPCVELGQFGLDSEFDQLKRDKQVLMVELVKLRHEHQNTKVHLKAVQNRLTGAETKQKQMMGFFAKMIQNPSFVQQVVQHGQRKELVDAISKKRRAIDQCPSNADQGVEIIGSEVLPPAMNMQNLCETSKLKEERKGEHTFSLDKLFWEELLNDGIEEDLGFFGTEAECEEKEEMEIGFLGP